MPYLNAPGQLLRVNYLNRSCQFHETDNGNYLNAIPSELVLSKYRECRAFFQYL